MQTPYATTYPASWTDDLPISSAHAGDGLGSLDAALFQPQFIDQFEGDTERILHPQLSKPTSSPTTIGPNNSRATIPLYSQSSALDSIGVLDDALGVGSCPLPLWPDQIITSGSGISASSTFEDQFKSYGRSQGLYTTPYMSIPELNILPSFSRSCDIHSIIGVVPEQATDFGERSSQTMKHSIFSVPGYVHQSLIDSFIPFASENSADSRFTCEWRGCQPTRSFGRRADLERHVRNFHTAPRVHRCVESRCTRKFRRNDKLQEHIRKAHGKIEISHTGAIM